MPRADALSITHRAALINSSQETENKLNNKYISKHDHNNIIIIIMILNIAIIIIITIIIIIIIIIFLNPEGLHVPRVKKIINILITVIIMITNIIIIV